LTVGVNGDDKYPSPGNDDETMAIARRKEVVGDTAHDTHTSALTWVWALAEQRESERGVGLGVGVGVCAGVVRFDIGPRKMGG
jgi:hypothetical protein